MEGGSVRESFPPPGSTASVDKSRVLNVKPLRCLSPVFTSPPETPSFVCSPQGPFPPGLFPFYPFTIPQGSQDSDDPAQPIPSPMPAPIRSYRTLDPHFPNGNAGSSSMDAAGEGSVSFQKRRSSKLQKRTKRNPGIGKVLSDDFVIGCSPFQKDDGNREMVDYVLMIFDAVRRRLSQVEDAKEAPAGLTRNANLKSGNFLMNKGIRTNMRKRIGVVPGVEIGDIFFFRMEMCLVGLHSQSMAGIDYVITKSDTGEQQPLAVSIVSSGGYDDDMEDIDVLIYSGQGGNVSKKDKKVADQKLVKGNLALERSLHMENEVRVVRAMKDVVNPATKVYVYDGLYRIQESWTEKGKSGANIFKYKLVRLPEQPSAFAIWKSIEKWKEGYSSRPGVILDDLASGAENLRVSLVNDVDNEKGPSYFTYFPALKYSKLFKLLQPSFGCNCHNNCAPGNLNCSCIRKNGGDFPYTVNGVLVSRKPLVYECGPTCPCFPNCKNRVSQTGLRVRLEVFRTTERGWGLRSLDPIRAGTFICEYAGEVIDPEKVKQDGNEDYDDYVFDTARSYEDLVQWNYDPRLLDEQTSADSDEDNKTPPQLVITAKTVGNVARFMNHCCSPNVFWQLIQYEHNSESFLHVAFFAMKHIPPLTELVYDYGATQSEKYDVEGDNASLGKKKCLCGSTKCRGYFG